MTRPWKHPKTGVYYFRKRVPNDLRQRIGKEVHKESLRTKNVAEARRMHAIVASAVEEEWDRLRAFPDAVVPVEVQLTEKQVQALCGEVYREVVAEFGENPGYPSAWTEKLAKLQACLPYALRDDPTPPLKIQFGMRPQDSAMRRFSGDVGQFLSRRDLHVSTTTRLRMCMPYAEALRFAYLELKKRAGGDYSEDPNQHRFPPALSMAEVKPTGWEEIYAGYAAEVEPAPATQKRQKGIMRALFKFLGHNDPRKVVKADMIRWKDHCLTLKQPVTVRDADIAHPKAVFAWALDEGILMENPAVDVRVRGGKKKVKVRERGFTFEEAKTILSWSLVPVGGRTSVDRAAAIRWVPWLCHYTGARVNEITQARAEDVFQDVVPGHDPIWVINITPEAGGVKTRAARKVPLHPHLIEQGFLAYVQSRKGKCLFYDPDRSRGGSAGNPMYKKAGEALAGWVRITCGISDPNIQPNHAWRHRFRSACRAAKIEPEIIDHLDGHAPATVGQDYGDVWTFVALERISRLPRFEVKPAREGVQVVGAPNGVGKRPRNKRGAPKPVETLAV